MALLVEGRVLAERLIGVLTLARLGGRSWSVLSAFLQEPRRFLEGRVCMGGV